MTKRELVELQGIAFNMKVLLKDTSMNKEDESIALSINKAIIGMINKKIRRLNDDTKHVQTKRTVENK
ncbi:MAG: hypothetical protein ACRC45_03605 [Cetobacterium sp.]